MNFFNRTLLLLLVFVSFSCSKDSNSELEFGTFSLEVNGDKMEFKNVIATLQDFSGTQRNLGFSGTNLIQGESFAFSMILEQEDNLENEQSYSVNEDEGDIYFLLNWFEPLGDLDASSGETNGNATMTFSSIELNSGGECIGTFSGDLYDFETGIKYEIRNGEFNLSIN